ncbi:MAG: DUF6159 family protein [Chitinophagales bacterium]
MGFFDRLSKGWNLSLSSLTVLRKNKQLLIFPVLSGAALILLTISFLAILFAPNNWDIGGTIDEGSTANYIFLFIFYLLNYFIIVFFNMALIHCARIYFECGKPTIANGFSFSLSRIGDILAWSAVAATVGLIFRLLEENLGKIGQIITAILGVAWSITTFFVVPVIAYEGLTPIAAYKRSVRIMKEKWGESLGATFSFGIIQFISILIIGIPLFFIGSLINIVAGIILAAIGVFFVFTIISAAQTIFISAVYHNINNKPTPDFNPETLDGIFIHKEKKKLF